MKILLITPPYRRFFGLSTYCFPIGLAYLAELLNRNGHNAKIYDMEIDSSGDKDASIT